MLLLLGIALSGALQPAWALPDPELIWRRTFGYAGAPAPIAVDLDLDGRLDIVQVNISRNVVAVDPEDGSVLWERDLGKHDLLSPVGGHFLGDKRINVVVPCTDGQIFVLDGATGRDATQTNTGFNLSMSPVTFPWTDDDPSAPYREGLLVYDATGFVYGYLISPRGTLEQVFSFSTGGQLSAPPLVGPLGLASPLPHIAFVTIEGRVTVFGGRANPPEAFSIPLPGQPRCNLGLSAGDLNNDGALEMVIADALGYLHALTWRNGKLEPVWTDTVNGQPQPVASRSVLSQPSHTPAMIDVDGDGASEIVVPRAQSVGLLRGNTGLAFWGEQTSIPTEYAHDMTITSPPALFRTSANDVFAAFGDMRGVSVINLKTRKLESRYQINRESLTPPLVGPLRQSGMIELFSRTTTDGMGYLLNLGLAENSVTMPWLGPGGGSTRTNSEPKSDALWRRAQYSRLSIYLQEMMTKAQEFATKGEWARAIESMDRVLATSPHYRQANELRRYYFFREYMILLLLAAGLLLAGAVALLWLAWRHGRASVLRKLARRADKKGDTAKAIKIYYRLCQSFPKQRSYIRHLAEIFIREKHFNAESAPVFQRARLHYPEEERYLKALATSYSAVPRLDDQAAAAYLEMAQIAKKPGPWFFILGQAYMDLHQPREALEAFRHAIVHQHDDPRLPDYMADLYIELGITSPDILPTLERVLEQRKGDAGFLQTYCSACTEARRYDEQAAQLAEALLLLDPAAPAAHTILATRNLQAGRHKEAMRHAQQILQGNPNSPVGLRLLGACYAAENRLDETAMQIFAKALEANPEAPEILLAVSHGFIQTGRDDAEARELYQKAIIHSPQDETILAQLAHIASKDNDDDLTMRAIEPLLTLGRHDRQLVLQLANAYCRLGIIEDKAEPIYSEALLHQPDHATIQDNLAAIYMRRQRCDQDSAKVFESVFARNPERLDIGMQLLRCYHAAELHEKVLELGQKLQERMTDNPELQKMMAAASERADQMESAIARYEQVRTGNPADREAILALSSLYGRRRRSDNPAIEVYNKAIQLEPQQPDAYLAAARAYARRSSPDHVIQTIKHLLTQNPGQTAATLELMETLVEASPREYKLRWYLIDMLIFDGRLRDARKHLMDVLRLDSKQSELALAAFDKILEKNPKDAVSHLERGRILMALDREREARHAMEQAHRYHPENEEITRALMGLYQKMLTTRDSAEIRFQLGRLAMRLDKHDLAISCFQQTSRDYRWEAESVLNLARCFMAKGMLDLALHELKRLPVENDVKDLLYELGQRYEAVQDIQGAREVYKLIFAADITFKDVKGKLETLVDAHEGGGGMHAERTAIINSLSEEAKQRYELVQELGRGAMGIVYKARDNELDEFVALKILPDSLIRNQEAVRRFRQEARNARRLAHPNIVRIHDIGEEMGRKYISMEFVQGSDLKLKLRQNGRKLPFETILKYVRQICEAMAYAHSIGIVHRDIKPANLMLTKEDQIKVTDFGIAKMIEQTAAPDATQAGAIIGTPLYMSPEQVKGAAVDHRADIYSMGIVFYEMANGRPPFVEGDLSYQHLFVDPKPLPAEIPADFARIVMKCLAKDPAQRWQTSQEILDEVRRIWS